MTMQRSIAVQTILVLCFLLVGAGAPIEPTKRVIEKTSEVAGKKLHLTSQLADDSSTLQIREVLNTPEHGTNGVLANIPVTTLGPSGWDFAVVPDGRVLWVFLQQKQPLVDGWTSRIYLLSRKESARGQFRLLLTKRTAGGKEFETPCSVDLRGILQSLIMNSIDAGNAITPGENARIGGVVLMSTNSSMVTVSGELGERYQFKGTVLMGEDCQLATRDFSITPKNDGEGKVN